MTKDEALKLALEALEFIPKSGSMLGTYAEAKRLEAIAAIKEALAQLERCKYPNCDYPCMNLPDCQMQGEPTVNTFNPDYDGVAWMYEEMKAMARELEELKAQPEQPKVRTGDCLLVGVCASEGHKIAPQRSEASTWVGLTEEEIDHIYWQHQNTIEHQIPIWPYERTIEAKLKAKNERKEKNT